MATAASAAALISASAASSPSFQFSSLSEINSCRLKAIVERLAFIMNSKSGSIRLDSAMFLNLCHLLARGVDYALSINDAPTIAHHLPSLIKQVYQHRDESSLQPAIMMLMISVKNACKSGWFTIADADELLKMANELSRNFCMAMSVIAGVGNDLDIISVLVSRFYPQFKMGTLIASFKATPYMSRKDEEIITDHMRHSTNAHYPLFLKNDRLVPCQLPDESGYEILMSDFQIARNLPQEEKIMLIVVQTDNLETSSCIISPSQVSFLVNGKGVDRRTNVSLDNGPQFPTDITKMLKFGANIFQAIGYFSGTYLIALAFMSKITLSNTPILKDYAQPVVVVGADSEIIEGASRITLNCPISFRRIRTPVKGHLCKHHQCFDYVNFMEMNSRKPAWRCPCCNQTVSFTDLRIDQNMVKILKEVDPDVVNVVISVDGSWKMGIEYNRTKDKPQQENISRQQDCHEDSAYIRSQNTLKVDVDLTIGEDGQNDSATSPSQMGAQYDSFSQGENHDWEAEDVKPFKDSHDLHICQELPVPTQPPSSFKRMRVNGPNSNSLSTNDSSSDTEMQTVFRTSDLSMTQDRDHQANQQVESPALQHVVTVRPSNLISTRVASSLPGGLEAYGASLQPSSDNRASLGPASDGRGPKCNPSNLRSLIMSGSYRPNNVALPSGAARELARQVAQQKLQLQTGVNSQASRVAVSSAATADGLWLSGVVPSSNSAEQPLDKNWRPTGQMRGSLTGSAYSAALTHYKPPTTQMKQARLPASTIVTSATVQHPTITRLQKQQQ